MKHLEITVCSIIFFVMFCSLLIIPDRVQAASENVVGQWVTLMNGTTTSVMPINPIHTALLDNGQVLIVAGSENDPTNKRKVAAVWNPYTDPQASHISVRNLNWDLFCNAMTHLPDGQVAIVGGTTQYDPYHGSNNTIIYDPVLDIFTQSPSMTEGRWYPTSTALGDGRTHTIGGLTDYGTISRNTEILDATGMSWTLPKPLTFTPDPHYPRGHLMPNGRIFYSAPDRDSRSLIPVTGQSSIIASHLYAGNRKYGSAVLLPLGAPFDQATVLVMGGNTPATNSVESIILTATSNFSVGTWSNVPSMASARIEMNATLLPNGEVLVTGGSAQDNVPSTAARTAEAYNPATNSWRTLAAARFPRLYHSVALLIPDATVWTAGSNPQRGTYDTHMEIFRPPYLFTTNTTGQVVSAPRPVINSVPSSIRYGSSFNLSTVNAAVTSSVVMIRLGAVTHAFDMDQRMLRLSYSNPVAGQLSVQAPTNSNVAPPGYYMLFILNRSGVPSVAKFVNISANPNPTVSISAPAKSATVGGTSVAVAANATDHVGVSGVQFKLDGSNLGAEDTASPYAITWNSTTATNGPHTLTAVARNVAGLTTTSAGVGITVNNTTKLPDVFVLSFSYANGRFSSLVKNQGTAATPAGVSVTVGYYVDGTYKTWGGVLGSLAAGASVTIGAAYTIPTGTHTIMAWVDDDNYFVELNETNNQLSQNITIP